MPKQPLFESFKHQFLLHARSMADIERLLQPTMYLKWQDFINSLIFTSIDWKTIKIYWDKPKKGNLKIKTDKITWYYRGDTVAATNEQTKRHLIFSDDKIQKKTQTFFIALIKRIAKKSGLKLSSYTNYKTGFDNQQLRHFIEEEKLFDTWAKSIDLNTIDIIKSNEVCTAPEMRYITKYIGNIKGKTLLDIGSGLGEASIYFALQGAKVTSIDLSREMLKITERLAKKYKVKISTIQMAVEYLKIPKSKQFDIIYAGNLFHHVNIPLTLDQLIPHLKRKGILVCWEPVSYNPIINLYRKIATEIRSDDERPIRLSDINIFRSYFNKVSVQWFWLTTLIIFVIMIIGLRRNPNKIRLWKKIVEEGDRWKPFYLFLESIDNVLLRVFPFLGLLCWNVVLICNKPTKIQVKKVQN